MTRPDFLNVPHFRHVTVLAIVEVAVGVLTNAIIGERAISSRPGIGRRVTDWRGAASHTACEIDP